jgi:hypothetical protein
MRWRLSLAVFVLGAVIAFWPAPRIDLSPIQRPLELPTVDPTESVTSLEKPKREPHPATIYGP